MVSEKGATRDVVSPSSEPTSGAKAVPSISSKQKSSEYMTLNYEIILRFNF